MYTEQEGCGIMFEGKQAQHGHGHDGKEVRVREGRGQPMSDLVIKKSGFPTQPGGDNKAN